MTSPVRTLASGVQAAIAEQTGSFIHFIKFEFSSGDLRLTTAGGHTTMSGEGYSSVGGTLHIGQIKESSDGRVSPVALTLDGVDTSVFSLMLTDNLIGRNVTIWRAYQNDSTSLIADPVLLGEFRMNDDWVYEEQHSTREGPVTAIIRTSLTTALTDGKQTKGITTNLRSHQKLFSGDLFFDYVEFLAAGVDLRWKGRRVGVGGRDTDGGGRDPDDRERFE